MNKRERHLPVKKKQLVAGILAGTLCILTLILIVGWQGSIGDWIRRFSSPVVKEISLTGINSPYVIMIQAQGGSAIARSRSEEKVYPASLTKVMTVIIALEHLRNPDQTCTVKEDIFPELYEVDASRAGFEPGEIVTVRDLLYGAMLPSGAECSLTLADEAAGSEEAFVELMNKKCEKLGMTGTHFCNTTGLHQPEHYSTVRDLAVLMKYAIRNKAFREMAESAVHTTAPTNIHPEGLTFYSTLFSHLPDPEVTGGRILGGKTGYTGTAGLCLASYAMIEGREYILVTCGAEANGNPLHIYDAVTLYNRVGEEAQALMKRG